MNKNLKDIKIDMDNKLFCDALFIDLTKAFDTVDQQIFINFLLKVGDVHNVARWVLSYRPDHTQYVRLGNIVSDPFILAKSVPQGSILGPLLVIFYVNSICDQLTYCSYHLYADETIWYSCAPSFEAAVSNLQERARDWRLLSCLLQCLYPVCLVSRNTTKR